MKKLEECKEMYKDIYMNCLGNNSFEKNRFTSTELAAFETLGETLKFVYGSDFDRIKKLWQREALNEYYSHK